MDANPVLAEENFTKYQGGELKSSGYPGNRRSVVAGQACQASLCLFIVQKAVVLVLDSFTLSQLCAVSLLLSYRIPHDNVDNNVFDTPCRDYTCIILYFNTCVV